MEDNKYYTPELGEISSDFEFEVYNSKDRFFFEGAEGWYKTKMDYGVLGNLPNLQRLILDKQIRVQVLNKENIEAEGFKRDSGDYDFIKDQYQIELIDGKVYITDQFGARDLFFGVIKNRSELRKILKMIGV
jgi:hypothetical protein